MLYRPSIPGFHYLTVNFLFTCTGRIAKFHNVIYVLYVIHQYTHFQGTVQFLTVFCFLGLFWLYLLYFMPFEYNNRHETSVLYHYLKFYFSRNLFYFTKALIYSDKFLKTWSFLWKVGKSFSRSFFLFLYCMWTQVYPPWWFNGFFSAEENCFVDSRFTLGCASLAYAWKENSMKPTGINSYIIFWIWHYQK